MKATSADGISADICTPCHLAWFDAHSYSLAPTIAERGARTLPQDELEKIARRQALGIAAEYRLRFRKELPLDDAIALVPGLAGLPLEEEERLLARRPWFTWISCFVLFGLGLWSVTNPSDAEPLGFVATELDRLGGAAFITSLLVHATLFQLLTNVYFLLIFGDNVEDFLGSGTFALLALSGGLFGTALHALFASDDPAVLMGASGCVSAVTVFYALRFPSARLRYLRWFRWATMPATAGLLFWLVTKLASTQSFFGRAEPTVWPYVGGALTGLVFWLVLRDSSVWSD